MKIETGTLILVPFPFTDLSDSKVRPALVASDVNEFDVIVVFISSVVLEELNQADFLILSNSRFFNETGLKKDSIVKCDKIMTLSKSIILGEIGSLPQSIFQNEIKPRLKIALKLD